MVPLTHRLLLMGSLQAHTLLRCGRFAAQRAAFFCTAGRYDPRCKARETIGSNPCQQFCRRRRRRHRRPAQDLAGTLARLSPLS